MNEVMQMKIASKRHRRRGQALVEAALLSLVFFVIMIGMLDLGQMLFLHQTLAERVQAAVRWGVTNNYDPTSIANLVLYGNTSPGQNESPFWGLSASNVAVSNPGCGPDPNIDCRVTIVISGYTYNLFSAAIIGKFFGGPGNTTYSGQTIQASLPSELANATQ